MKRWFVTLRIVVLVAILTVTLSTCREEPIRHRATLSAGRSLSASSGFNIVINSDCVEPGQPLVMTPTLSSRYEVIAHFADTPSLDIVLLRNAQPATQVANWSTSAEYPATIAPLQPLETRVYTWTWTPTDAVGPLWVDVHITIQDAEGQTWDFADHILSAGVGEGYGKLGADDVLAKCADMQPAR